jgi:hypothetical protein
MSSHMNQITRTTADLIAELEGESEDFDTVGIAVGFEKNAKFIFSDDADRIKKLNAALGQGGQAIGLIGIKRLGSGLSVSSRVFREYEGEQWAQEFLDDLSDFCGQKLKHALGTKSINELLN